MKKLATLLLVLVSGIMLTACGGGGGGTSSDSRDTTTTTAGHALISWVAPTTRSDSSYLPLTELEGYRIYYGTSADDLDVLVDLNDSSITEYDVNTLPAGNYYFAVSAYDTQGVESGLSNVINKDV